MYPSKSFFNTLFIASLASFALCQDTDLNTVKAAFENANIPGNATITFDPTILLEVVFPQSDGDAVDVSAGGQLTTDQTALSPKFGIYQSNASVTADDTFVVAMLDLDAPTPQDPSSAQIRHFLGGSFAVGDLDTNGTMRVLYNSSVAISEFIQPSPPDGSDAHRYVFLLYNQSSDFSDQTYVNSTTSTSNFNISEFAQEVGLGDPLGGTFIMVGPDSST